jgi:predicted phage-related endonuclease
MNIKEMNTQVHIDLHDLASAMESLQTMFSGLPQAIKVDVAARLHPLVKAAELIDKMVKEEVKTALKDEPGIVNGQMFKAVVKHIETSRLDQKGLKETYPKIHAKFYNKVEEARVTFEVK